GGEPVGGRGGTARRKADMDRQIMGKWPRIGTAQAGKIVTVLLEDTCYRVLDGDTELSTQPIRPRPSGTSHHH
uniref:hypothetical protein n=1 Tax=Streptomyces phytophilus TaxID=722715 RepID=UPI001C691CC8